MLDAGKNVVIAHKYPVSRNQYPVSRLNQLQVLFYANRWVDLKNIFLRAIFFIELWLQILSKFENFQPGNRTKVLIQGKEEKLCDAGILESS